jgi:hypothetical protein
MKLRTVAWAVFTPDNELYYELGKNFIWTTQNPHAEDNAIFTIGSTHAKKLGLCVKQLVIIEEYNAETLSDQRNELLDNIAAIALAIQASGRPEVHKNLVEVIKMLPTEIRRCPNCGCLDSYHYPDCKLGKLV